MPYVSAEATLQDAYGGTICGSLPDGWPKTPEHMIVERMALELLLTMLIRRFNSLCHEYELRFDDRAQILEVEDDSTIPSQL